MKTYELMRSDKNITETAKRMVVLAKKTKGPVTAKFNDVVLTAKPGDNPDAIVQYYQTESNRLHEEYVKSPDYKKQQREAKKAQQRHNLMLKDALAIAPAKMTLRDEESWKKRVVNNTDGYGGKVTSFAERWARLMEGRMANGDTLEACSDETFSLANNEDISGFMKGCALYILSQEWIHGEQLCRWHNLKIQTGREGEKANESGEVLNPALLSSD